jgi:hypothetical protein
LGESIVKVDLRQFAKGSFRIKPRHLK